MKSLKLFSSILFAGVVLVGCGESDVKNVEKNNAAVEEKIKQGEAKKEEQRKQEEQRLAEEQAKKEQEKKEQLEKQKVIDAVVEKWEVYHAFESESGKFVEDYDIRVNTEMNEIHIDLMTSLYDKQSNEDQAKRTGTLMKTLIGELKVDDQDYEIKTVIVKASNGSFLYSYNK